MEYLAVSICLGLPFISLLGYFILTQIGVKPEAVVQVSILIVALYVIAVALFISVWVKKIDKNTNNIHKKKEK